MFKIKATIIIILSLILCLASCGNKKYRNDLSCSDISEVIKNNDVKEFQPYGNDYLSYILSDTSCCNDFSIIYSRDANDIDEFGVLHANSEEDADRLLKMLGTYIEDAKNDQRAFIASYAPNELSKLDSARVQRFGNYVIYSISSEEAYKKISSAIEALLAE